MLFSYIYINHTMEKLQEFMDYIFYDVWCKAPNIQYDILTVFNGNQGLKDMMFAFSYSDAKASDFFARMVEEIFYIFQTLSFRDITQLQVWYSINNNIEILCCDNETVFPATYEDISRINTDLAIKLKGLYMSLYKAEFLGLKAVRDTVGEIDNHYDSFMKINKKGRCPFCGLHDIKGVNHSKREAYDHFLPKSKYPFNSINFRNLAPICHECNSDYKGTKDPLYDSSNKRRKAFYSYMAYTLDIQLKIDILNPNIENLCPNDIDLHIQSEKYTEEVETWMDLFGIEERYKAKCISDGCQYWLIQIVDEMSFDNKTLHEFLESLHRYADKFPFDNASFLKLAFLEACERKNLLSVG